MGREGRCPWSNRVELFGTCRLHLAVKGSRAEGLRG